MNRFNNEITVAKEKYNQRQATEEARKARLKRLAEEQKYKEQQIKTNVIPYIKEMFPEFIDAMSQVKPPEEYMVLPKNSSSPRTDKGWHFPSFAALGQASYYSYLICPNGNLYSHYFQPVSPKCYYKQTTMADVINTTADSIYNIYKNPKDGYHDKEDFFFPYSKNIIAIKKCIADSNYEEAVRLYFAEAILKGY